MIVCLFHLDKFNAKKTVVYDPEIGKNLSDITFDNLDYGNTYNVCVTTEASDYYQRSGICYKGSHNAICRSVMTTCEPLPKAKDKPSQIVWSAIGDTFNPFTDIKIEMKKGTFDGEKSGLSKFKIK